LRHLVGYRAVNFALWRHWDHRLAGDSAYLRPGTSSASRLGRRGARTAIIAQRAGRARGRNSFRSSV